MTTRVTKLWDLIEDRGFREDIKDISNNKDDDGDGDNHDDNDNNDEKNNHNIDVEGITALALHGDVGFSRGYREYQVFCR